MITYDFHIHSALSPCADNEMTPNNIVNMASIMGISAIAISDHNSIGNVLAVTKVAEKSNIKVVPAMEVETAEEVHIITLFPDMKAASYVAKIVYDKLPNIKNRADIFGEQCIMDENDNIIGHEEKMLISPTMLSINELYDIVNEVGGLFVPAHVDRHSYSVLTNLGFIPDDMDIKYIEVSKKVDDLDSYLSRRKELLKYKILRSSDSHYLDSMASIPSTLDIDKLF